MEKKNYQTEVLAQTFELGQAKLRLRSELKFTLHQDANSQWYLVEDEPRANYFRVGVTEYAFLSLLDGKRTLDQAIAELSSISNCGDISEQKAASLARWVIESGLAETPAVLSENRIEQKKKQREFERNLQLMNPITFKIPLFNPDPILTRIHLGLRSLFGLPIFVVWLAVCLAGALTTMMCWANFWQHHIAAFSQWDFFWIGIAWLVLKVFHELAHGLACKQYGGDVRSFGVMILLLIPLPFVDVTSSWRFVSKRQRILTSAAGMLAEMFIASIAVMVWVNCEPGPLRYQLGNLFIAATIHTLLFNINPLMKFDGYYMLADWLEIPNLYTRGRSYVKSKAKHLFFGIRNDNEIEPTARRRRIVKAYGIASIIWMVLICVSLGLAALSFFSGIGLILAALGILFWLGFPLIKLAKYLFKSHETENPSRLQFIAVSFGIAILTTAIFTLTPSPQSISAPFVIKYDDLAVVRARSSGFVNEIFVQPGQMVNKGDILATLENHKLLSETQTLEVEIRTSALRAKAFRNDGEIASWKIENETLTSLLVKQRETNELVQHLTIRAPQSGKVIGPQFNELKGQFLSKGQEFLSIGDSNSKYALAMVHQSDASWLRSKKQQSSAGNGHLQEASLQVWGNSGSRLEASIRKVSVRATDFLPHFAFASNYGGPLNVVGRSSVDSETNDNSQNGRSGIHLSSQKDRLHLAAAGLNTDSSSTQEMKLVGQYVPVEIQLPLNSAENLLVGQTGQMFVAGRETSLGQFCFNRVRGWLSRSINLTHGL